MTRRLPAACRVHVLTSGRTFSGGEELAYDMQVMDLATVVGETTGGGSNPGAGSEIDALSQSRVFEPNGPRSSP